MKSEIWYDFGVKNLKIKFGVILGVTDLKIFQHEGGYRMAKIAFSWLKINSDRPKYHLINIFSFRDLVINY